MRLNATCKARKIVNKITSLSKKCIDKLRKVNHIELIVISIFSIVLCTCAITRYVNNNRLIQMLSDMYYLDLVEAKERYLLLEVETNPFLSIDRNSEGIEIAVLHLKSGEIYNVTVDVNKNLFAVDNETNKMLCNRVFKYNKTIETKLQKESRKRQKGEIPTIMLDLKN